MNSRLAIILALLQASLISCGQSKSSRTIFGKEFARVQLEQSLNDKSLHNVVNNKTELVADSVMAVDIAEKILFKIYGQSNIEKQRPYEIYKIENYWSISGTLPQGWLGGTFLYIMDARDGRIIRISHGK